MLEDNFKTMHGFVKIWQTDNETGKSDLVVDKNNLILYQGSNLLAGLLAGTATPINMFYVGFNNNSTFVDPTIDLQYSQPFNTLPIGSGFGFLRLPLSLTPSFLTSSTNYNSNVAVFTVQISSATAFYGNTFSSGVSNIYECALVSAPNPTSSTNDVIFSRVNFNQIQYVNSSSLTILWGVQFQSA